MNGRRIFHCAGPHAMLSGEYGRWEGAWYAITPNGHAANLGSHEVLEHPDGSITVSPSIRVSTSRDGKPIEVWHGFLERGVWRTA